MKISSAKKWGKLIDKVYIYRKCQLMFISRAEKHFPVYHKMSAKEIERVMSWYFLQLKKHIESLDERAFILPHIGGIIYDKQRKEYLDYKYGDKRRVKEEEKKLVADEV